LTPRPVTPGPQDRKLNHKLARQIIKEARRLPSVAERMRLISAKFIGAPYFVGPLVGSASEPEEFVATLAGFDCVTYQETVLALAWANDVDEFLNLLRRLRYKNGEVSYAGRLHYSTDWVKANVKRGFLRDLTRGADTLARTKTVDFLKDFKPRAVTFRYFPKRKLGKVSRRFQDGDLIFFASTRQGLDTFHVGLLFRDGGRLLMRHAARSRGGVVEQELAEFVQANPMPGFIVARPVEQPESLCGGASSAQHCHIKRRAREPKS
jgi:cell wall-associated NlpC family hydrolase